MQKDEVLLSICCMWNKVLPTEVSSGLIAKISEVLTILSKQKKESMVSEVSKTISQMMDSMKSEEEIQEYLNSVIDLSEQDAMREQWAKEIEAKYPLKEKYRAKKEEAEK